ncbi:phage baseplate assembly protein V [Haladaptatus sp. DFWS20]|uniref:phage baseplate assembly protein V n=1 Tax=Haladaptatus sp. DFWS20 TaxID=3403467 RepID=UPI003EBFAF9F
MSIPEFTGDNGGLGGVAVGIVTNNKDPKNLGRVRLQFPWRDADDESYWARIATPMAGKDRGTYFLPEPEDEVLVAFENRDIHHPYVIGALWNGEDEPPEKNADGKNDVRKIRSRSGHEVVFDDSESEGKVEITTNGGHTVVLDDSGGGAISIEDAGQNKIEFDSEQGAITLSSSTKLTIDTPMLELKADGNANIEASGVLTLKGSIVNIN